MDELSASFVNEAKELLENLEQALLVLENNPDDEEQINTAFRVMHSLKGTGAMFGFEELSAFTHEMESLYDLVRSGKRKVNKQLIDFTFKSIDLIRLLLEKPDDTETQKLKQQLLKECASKFGSEPQSPETTQTSPVKPLQKEKSKPATWYIRFEPHRSILQNGTRPLYLLDELAEAGNLKAFLHTEKIPAFKQLRAENVYVWWDLLLTTGKNENFIKDVFIFVEDESRVDLKKVADEDLLSLPDAETEIKKLKLQENITTQKLQQLAETLLNNTRKAQLQPPEPQRQAEKKETTPGNKKPTVQYPATIKSQAKKVAENPQKRKDDKHHDEPSSLQNSIRVSSEKLDELLDIISEVVTTQARLLHYSQQHQSAELENITETYEKLSRRLRENALNMRLIPIYTILIRFKRLVRDLSAQLHKEVILVTTGTETELDKSMIEKLYDPLMHIIRNSIDHGIEAAEERLKTGKKPQGTIRIDTSYSGANVKIKISDDGRGIDPENLKNTAIQKGFIQPRDTKIPDKELLQLIFKPGFTTSPKVSNVSGRGVGMDVVKKNIEELRGNIEVETKKGKGTTITITLPLTLSIIDGLLVYVGKNRYIIPVNEVRHVYPVTRKQLQKTINHVITKESKQIPFVDLTEEFNEKTTRENEMYLVVIEYGKNEMGLVIHSIVGKYQAVIKPLSRIVQKQEIFSGASILGDGEIALVIDPNKMINKFINLT